jgi:VanZ family protein
MQLLKNIIKYQAIYLTILFGLIIAYGTLTPIDGSVIPGSDKWKHFVAFAVFVFPISLFKPKWTWLIFLIGVLYGGAIEIIQPYVNRYREMGDFWANTIGAIIGVIIARFILILKFRRASPSE